MGLGKTLVILATIAGSLDRGEDFIRTEKRIGLENPQPSKATLIVTPSPRKYQNLESAVNWVCGESEAIYSNILFIFLVLLDSWIDEIRK